MSEMVRVLDPASKTSYLKTSSYQLAVKCIHWTSFYCKDVPRSFMGEKVTKGRFELVMDTFQT